VVNKIDQKYDFGASLGGYVVKDKLWFFGAYNRINQTNSSTIIQPIAAPGTPPVGSVIPTDITTDTFAGICLSVCLHSIQLVVGRGLALAPKAK
jgi:hypothetical protein